jgi:hypothetical protein
VFYIHQTTLIQDFKVLVYSGPTYVKFIGYRIDIQWLLRYEVYNFTFCRIGYRPGNT